MYSLPFSDWKQPPGSVRFFPVNPNDAPFKEVFDKAFLPMPVRMVADGWGAEPIIAALQENDEALQREVAFALGRIRNPHAVEPLIALLQDKDWSIRFAAVKFLMDITGQNFGDDQTKWQEWWEENKKETRTGR